MTEGSGQSPVPEPAGREFEIALGVFRRADKALSSANALTEAAPTVWIPPNYCWRPRPKPSATAIIGVMSGKRSFGLPKAIGNLNRQNAAEIWNSPAAIAIRQSVHDGSYRNCSRMHCPKLSGRTLEKNDNITNPRLRKIAQTNQTVRHDKPRKIILKP